MVSTKTLRNYAQSTSHTAKDIARNRLFSYGGPNQWIVWKIRRSNKEKEKFNSCRNWVQQCANTDSSIQSSYCIGKSRHILSYRYRYDNMCLTVLTYQCNMRIRLSYIRARRGASCIELLVISSVIYAKLDTYRYDNMCLTWRKLLRKSPITRYTRLHVELVCRTTARHRAVTRSIPEISKNELNRLNNCKFVANENNTKIPVLVSRTVLTVNFHGHPASMEH